MKLFFGFMIVFLLTIPATAMRPNSNDYSILNECLWNKEVLSIDTECNDMFNHYLPENSGSAKDTKEMRLGSYNIFRLSEQRKSKRLDLIAQMMDSEWDLVALSEIQSNKSTDLKLNVNAQVAFRDGKINEDQLKKAYALPTYVLLLLELQKLDPTWGLILSPTSYGDESDMFGFLYRNSTVKPVESKYCKDKYITNKRYPGPFVFDEIAALDYGYAGKAKDPSQKELDAGVRDDVVINDRAFINPDIAYACPLALEGDDNALFSKIPLTARFRANNFEASYISLHLRYRVNPTCDADCKKGIYESLLAEADGDNKKAIEAAVMGDGELKDGEIQELARFFETRATTRAGKEIQDLENDKDVIIAGDFNLEIEADGNWRNNMWEVAVAPIAGAQVFNKEKTSLGAKGGYANNYDHFILSTEEGATDECDVSTVRRIDVISGSTPLELASGFPLADILADIENPNKYGESLEYFTELMQDRAWVSSTMEKVDGAREPAFGAYYEYDELMATEFADLPKEFKDKQDVCTLGGVREKNKDMNMVEATLAALVCNVIDNERVGKYMATFSDHVPISMTCNTENSDPMD